MSIIHRNQGLLLMLHKLCWWTYTCWLSLKALTGKHASAHRGAVLTCHWIPARRSRKIAWHPLPDWFNTFICGLAVTGTVFLKCYLKIRLKWLLVCSLVARGVGRGLSVYKITSFWGLVHTHSTTSLLHSGSLTGNCQLWCGPPLLLSTCPWCPDSHYICIPQDFTKISFG